MGIMYAQQRDIYLRHRNILLHLLQTSHMMTNQIKMPPLIGKEGQVHHIISSFY